MNKSLIYSGYAVIATGVVMFLSYMVFLPLQSAYEQLPIKEPGLIFYSLGTAGCAFVAWGLMLLAAAKTESVASSSIFKATGVGILLLGVMRAVLVVFPHDPFDTMMAVPIIESIAFIIAGIWFLRK